MITKIKKRRERESERDKKVHPFTNPEKLFNDDEGKNIEIQFNESDVKSYLVSLS